MKEDVLDLLSGGDIEVLGLLPYSSNYTFLTKVTKDGRELLAVYKPRRGERPLWDFQHGSLAAREVAAYEVSRAAGWHLVPPTVLRDDAPLGNGSLQLFIEHDPERHYFVFVEQEGRDLRSFAAFDAAINNADRKGGHVIEARDGKLWAVDHGVSFHVEPKLRTVIWVYAEDPLSADALDALQRLEAELEPGRPLYERLGGLLAAGEVDATRARVRDLLRSGSFPAPSTDRPLPWPLI